MPKTSSLSTPVWKSVMWAAAAGAFANTNRSAPPPPVMVSEPAPALKVSAPFPPIRMLPGELLVELITPGGGAVGAGVGAGAVGVVPPLTGEVAAKPAVAEATVVELPS